MDSNESDPTYCALWYWNNDLSSESESSASHPDSFYEREGEEALENEPWYDWDTARDERHRKRREEKKAADSDFVDEDYITTDSEASIYTDLDFDATSLEQLYLPDMMSEMNIDDNAAANTSDDKGEQNGDGVDSSDDEREEDSDESSDGMEGYSENRALQQIRFEQECTDLYFDRERHEASSSRDHGK